MTCKICRDQASADSPYKVYEDDFWLVRHSEETNILGYFIIEPKRHFLDLAEATEKECAGYGILLAKVMKSMRSIVECRRIYTFSLAEANPHFHVHVIPRAQEFPRAYVGRGIMSYPLQPAADGSLLQSVCFSMKKAMGKL